jgi:hypothetical protein
LSLARIVLASSDASAARKAEGIAREISRRVGDARPVHEARCVEAEALARQGLLDEAQAVLERESAAAAQFGFGSAYRQASARLAWSRLLALEARHPRWKDDPEVLEQHMEWVDAAMAGALQAFLFDPDNAAAASAGLEDAFHYLIHLGREDEASLYAEDVAAFYPDSPAGMRAAHWLNSREDRGSKAEKEVELKQEATE